MLFILLISGFGIRAYRDLSRPEAWAYWKDQYFSPSMTSSLIARADPDGFGRGRPALVISGTIGPAMASWFRERLDQAHLGAGDTVLLSSPGSDLDQALIVGEIIRSRGLVTAVGVVDASGRIGPSYCASACVFVYAGGETRIGNRGFPVGGSSVRHVRARKRPRRRNPANDGDGPKLCDEDGGLFGRRGSDVRDQGGPLAQRKGSLRDEPHYASCRTALDGSRVKLNYSPTSIVVRQGAAKNRLSAYF
jgi:hypothetical protein